MYERDRNYVSPLIDDPAPMEIGNVEANFHFPGKPFKIKRDEHMSQRERYIRNNVCFTCHKVVCRT